MLRGQSAWDTAAIVIRRFVRRDLNGRADTRRRLQCANKTLQRAIKFTCT